MIPTKEIATLKREISTVEKYASKLVVTDKDTYAEAVEYAKGIKVKLKAVTDRKEAITKPLMDSLKSVRDLFRPIEVAGDNAIATIKGKLLEYQNAETLKAETAKRILADKVGSGAMTLNTALQRMDTIKTPDKTVQADNGTATLMNRTAYRVVDIALVPLEYLSVDMVKVRKAFSEGRPVPGCEAYQVNTISLR